MRRAVTLIIHPRWVQRTWSFTRVRGIGDAGKMNFIFIPGNELKRPSRFSLIILDHFNRIFVFRATNVFVWTLDRTWKEKKKNGNSSLTRIHPTFPNESSVSLYRANISMLDPLCSLSYFPCNEYFSYAKTSRARTEANALPSNTPSSLVLLFFSWKKKINFSFMQVYQKIRCDLIRLERNEMTPFSFNLSIRRVYGNCRLRGRGLRLRRFRGALQVIRF